jgi:hypothetical protein
MNHSLPPRVVLTIIVVSNYQLTAAVVSNDLPAYQVTYNDFNQSADPNNQSHFVPIGNDVYTSEIWERPYKAQSYRKNLDGSIDTGDLLDTGDNDNDSFYYAYNDIVKAQAGYNNDYLRASIEVVGPHTYDKGLQSTVGLKGSYYIYFSSSNDGKGSGYLLELQSGESGLTDEFSSGSALLYQYSGGNYGSSIDPDPIYARKADNNTIEFALDLSDNGVDGLDASFIDSVQFVRFGVATSNPSSPSDILARESHPEFNDFGVEYDTVGGEAFVTVVPEPTTSLYTLLGASLMLGFRRRNA